MLSARPGPLAAMLLLLLLALPLWAADAPIADTGYLLPVPAGYTVNTPKNAPNILLQIDGAGGNVSIQVIRGDGATAAAMATAYETKIRPAFKTWKQAEQGEVAIDGQPHLYRRYQATSDGMALNVQAVFVQAGDQRFVIHAISAGQPFDAMRGILASVRGPQLAVPLDAPVAIPGSRHTIAPPAGWALQPNPKDNSLGMTAPAGLPVLSVTAGPVDTVTDPPAAQVQQAMAQIATSLPKAQKGWKVYDEWNRAEGGVTEFGRRYTGTVNNAEVDALLIIQHRDLHLFAFFGMGMANARVANWATARAVMGSLALAGAPPTAPPVGTPDLEPDSDLHVVPPAGWAVNMGNGVFDLLPPKGSPAAATRIRIARFARADAHADLATSTEEALRQVRATPTANLLLREGTKVAGMPATLLEVSYTRDGAPHRLMQVVTVGARHAYWAIFYGPTGAYHDHMGLFEAMMRGMAWTDGKATPAVTPARGNRVEPSPTAGYQRALLPNPGVRFDIPDGWKVTIIDDSLVAESGAGVRLTANVYPRTLNGYKDGATALKTYMTGVPRTAMWPALGLAAPCKDGTPLVRSEWRGARDGKTHFVWVQHVELPKHICEVVVDASGTVFSIDKLVGDVKPHVQQLWDSLGAYTE